MDNMREIDEIKAKIDEAVKDIKSSATLREIKMKFWASRVKYLRL